MKAAAPEPVRAAAICSAEAVAPSGTEGAVSRANGGVRCAIVVDHEDPVARVRPGLGGLWGHRKRPRSSAKSEPGGWQRGHDVPVQAGAEFFGSGALDRRGDPERRPAAPKPAAVARHRRAADLRPAASTDARQLLGQLARGERRWARDARYVAVHAGPRARARAAGTALTTHFGARPSDGRRRLATVPAQPLGYRRSRL